MVYTARGESPKSVVLFVQASTPPHASDICSASSSMVCAHLRGSHDRAHASHRRQWMRPAPVWPPTDLRCITSAGSQGPARLGEVVHRRPPHGCHIHFAGRTPIPATATWLARTSCASNTLTPPASACRCDGACENWAMRYPPDRIGADPIPTGSPTFLLGPPRNALERRGSLNG